MAERTQAQGGSPSSNPSRTPPPHDLRGVGQIDISPAWPPLASSPPSNNGTPSTTHQAQLGKRSNTRTEFSILLDLCCYCH